MSPLLRGLSCLGRPRAQLPSASCCQHLGDLVFLKLCLLMDFPDSWSWQLGGLPAEGHGTAVQLTSSGCASPLPLTLCSCLLSGTGLLSPARASISTAGYPC